MSSAATAVGFPKRRKEAGGSFACLKAIDELTSEVSENHVIQLMAEHTHRGILAQL